MEGEGCSETGEGKGRGGALHLPGRLSTRGPNAWPPLEPLFCGGPGSAVPFSQYVYSRFASSAVIAENGMGLPRTSRLCCGDMCCIRVQ